jgi:translation initiation factor eIF-2B subunit epsilon
VIIAESFQKKFRPLSHERMKCLFPLANVPLIHYVIEFLLMNKVTEIFIAVSTHRAQMDAFLKNQSYKGVKIHVISLEACTNFGDALREINQLQTINNEFILVRGDLITNADISGALREHFRVKADDKEKKLTLTKLFIKTPFSNPNRSLQQEITLMLDSQTKEILKYETFGPGSHHNRFRLNEDYIPLKQSTRRFEVRYDLVDAEIAICSRDVLNFFTDNFDCPDLYDDYINEVQSNEIIDDRIMAYEIDGGAYYARVLDPRTYGAITQDVLSRHLHPLVVDSKLLCPKSSYTFQSFNRYFDQDVQVALNTNVSNNSMLGKYTKVGTNSHIETSTIGEKCIIGKNVKITNCYLWNNVEI